MVMAAGPPAVMESDQPTGMPVVTAEGSSSSLVSNALGNQHLTNTRMESKSADSLMHSLSSGKTSAEPATVIVTASQSSSSMPTLADTDPNGSQNQQQKSNSAFDELKRSSSLDSPGHDEERLTVVENVDDSSPELGQDASSSANAVGSNANHATGPAASVVVPLIKSKVETSTNSS